MLDGLEDGSVIRLSDDQTAPDGTKISAMRAWNYYRSKTDYFGDTSAQTTILNGWSPRAMRSSRRSARIPSAITR